MFIVKKRSLLEKQLAPYRRKELSIGFVPTMGALHEGHLSLIKASKESCDMTLCSVFVNPTQFNEQRDLEKYPRTPEKDAALLVEVGCDGLFLPSFDEVYPEGIDQVRDFNLGGLGDLWEGAHRPGHFDGVAKVVFQFLDLIKPDVLFLGQKDFQQVKVIAHMIEQAQFSTRIEMVPISREEDGLARSSRNVRLKPEFRMKVPIIFQMLQRIKKEVPKNQLHDLLQSCKSAIDQAGLTTEYLAVTDRKTLEPITAYQPEQPLVILAAVWAGEIRLIDNLLV